MADSKMKQGLEERLARSLKTQLFNNSKVWWTATAAYFGYVVLGGINWKVHRHVYTGDDSKSVVENLKNGQVATFRKQVYREYFFPSFLRYFKTYRAHVLMAGLWLVTGVYNLRNQPEFAGVKDGKKLFEGARYHANVSGYLYVISSAIKGVTAAMMSYYSHSLGYARWPMIGFGIYDVISLAIALYHILRGNVVDHKRWMIRNFAVGSGSIWVRVFGGIWAACDLEFMKSVEFYGKMNQVILCTGFTMGPLFGEWWIARTRAAREAFMVGMAGCCLATYVCAQQIYKEKAEKERLDSIKRPIKT